MGYLAPNYMNIYSLILYDFDVINSRSGPIYFKCKKKKALFIQNGFTAWPEFNLF